MAGEFVTSQTEAAKLRHEMELVRVKACPSCKHVAMFDDTEEIPDGYCGSGFCPNYRVECWTCCDKDGYHKSTQEHRKLLKEWKERN